MNLSRLLGETTDYDKKLFLEEKRPKSWLKSVSAFANGCGGSLLFGISDQDELIGLENAKAVSESISEILKTKMDPIPQVRLDIQSENGREFVILRVAAGQETPYYYSADGNRIAYVRIGNESVPADALTLKRLVLRGTHMSFDSMTSRFSFHDCAFTKLRSVYRARTGFELTDSDFLSFDLVSEDGMLTNAGALLADDSPIRCSRLFCTRWYGLDKASGILEALDDKEYTGSLISLLQNGMEFVKNNTKKRWKKTENGRVEMPEYPEQAVHESLVNALIHRDYMEIGSEVHIDIFDDRMEIYSPGGMFDGTLVQELDTDHIASKRRNPVIADIFSRMHFMERRGSGFRKIKTSYQNAVHYQKELEPKFTSTPSSFFVILYNLNYHVPVQGNVLLREKGTAYHREKVAFEQEKAAFEEQKAAFEEQKAAFELRLSRMHANAPTKEKTRILFAHFGLDTAFSRSDISNLFGLAPSSAGKLILKLKEASLLTAVKGQGKGKYRFLL